jgi:hypothetical protein
VFRRKSTTASQECDRNHAALLAGGSSGTIRALFR